MTIFSTRGMVTFRCLTLPRMAASSALKNSRRKAVSLPPWISSELFQPDLIEQIINASTIKLPAVGSLTVTKGVLWHLTLTTCVHPSCCQTRRSLTRFTLPHSCSASIWQHRAIFQRPRASYGTERLTARAIAGPNVKRIAFDSVRVGLIGERSVMDGTPTLAFMGSIWSALADLTFDYGSPSAPIISSFSSIEP